MCTISRLTYSLTRRYLLFPACFGLLSTSALATSPFFSVKSTPYDRQLVRVRSILIGGEQRQRPRVISMVSVNQWMTRLHSMPYQYFPKWKTPTELQLDQTADCKGKAVALYRIMHSNGAQNVRLIIGKYRIEDVRTHAWLEWQTQIGTFVLDPTFSDESTKREELDSSVYVPFYAYEGAHKYCAAYNAMARRSGLAPVSRGAE